ncbi:outer membrane lipoprotein carrier protein LolA [Panacagrimonas sp.]|uniref:outer membrane lipoprotein carrier protein LolA n=1 Tax=Panacagrimonas sp. TaxID=2480088 RepID=UPI003B52B865
MKPVCCGLIALLLATPLLAGEVFEHPQTPQQAQAFLHAAMPDLGQVQVLRGRYVQRKFLREIPRPLTSSGEFLLIRDRGIWWHTQVPLDAELMWRRDSGPASAMDIAASTFFALFALEVDALARRFELFGIGPEAPASPWQLGLRPRDAALADWLTQITLAGAGQLQQVNLLEATGDRTEIDIIAEAQPLSSLTPSDRLRFGP